MLESFKILMEHMAEEHHDSKWFGDNCFSDLETGETKIQICQICGKNLLRLKQGEIGETLDN